VDQTRIRHPRKSHDPIYIKPVAACVDLTLYQSNKPGPWNIYRLNSSANQSSADDNVSRGTGTNTLDQSPSRSPDTQYVAFASNRTANWEIYIGSIDGTTQQRVTYTTTAANLAPMWSPDGQFVAYESTRSGARNLYMVEVGTGVETRLTNDASQDVNPYWSPDSKTPVPERPRRSVADLRS
jgi:TolB protein